MGVTGNHARKTIVWLPRIASFIGMSNRLVAAGIERKHTKWGNVYRGMAA